MKAWGPMLASVLVGLNLALGPSKGDADECMRGDAKALVSSHRKGLEGYGFRKISRTEAWESFHTKSGDTFRIHHWGCEYFAVTVRFESKGLVGSDESKVVQHQAADALRRLYRISGKGIFDLPKAAAALESASQAPGLKGEDGIPVPGDGTDFLQTKVSISDYGAGFVEIQLAKGPL